jgi:TRAP-type C4-dicarboxylate transport system permease small subunit
LDLAGRLEVLFLVLAVATLVVLGTIQILLRNVFHRGLLWADPLMRHLVLWIGGIGGAHATTRWRHISIDLFGRNLRGRPKAIADRIVAAIASASSLALCIASLRLVVDERSFGDPAFLGIPTWEVQTVLPVAFFLIAYRSAARAVEAARAPAGVPEGGP